MTNLLSKRKLVFIFILLIKLDFINNKAKFIKNNNNHLSKIQTTFHADNDHH